jgi:hypothetical protein
LRLRIDPKEVTTLTAFSTYTEQWAVVWLIDETDDHVFLYTGCLTAHVIPKRAFRDDQHCAEFVALARKYKEGPKPTGILTRLPDDATEIFRPDND